LREIVSTDSPRNIRSTTFRFRAPLQRCPGARPDVITPSDGATSLGLRPPYIAPASISTFFDASLIASVPLVTVIYRKSVLKKTGVAEFFLDTHRHCIVAALAIWLPAFLLLLVLPVLRMRFPIF
jgi:hypothetical protein